jgi:queuine tRNA-ribosyltransferase
VTFTYEVDGQRTFLSPERSMAIQQKLGSPTSPWCSTSASRSAPTAPTPKPASPARPAGRQRSKAAHTRPDQSLFGIVQGGFWPDLRKRSAEEIGAIGFDGYAIGGLSVGEGHDKMCDVLDVTTPHMPQNHPRYLMGVGRPLDLVEAVARGVDMFDCVIQTRHARSGVCGHWQGPRCASPTAATARTCTRSTRPAPATPAAPSPGPTSTTCSDYIKQVGDPATGLPIGDTENQPQGRRRRRDPRVHRHVPGHGEDRAGRGLRRDRRLVRDPGEGREAATPGASRRPSTACDSLSLTR